MTRARFVHDAYVYQVRVRQTGAGLAITIPRDAVQALRWRPGDRVVVVLLDDGIVVSKADDYHRDGELDR